VKNGVVVKECMTDLVTKEAKENHIDLKENFDVVHAVVTYLYTEDYVDDESDQDMDWSAAVFNVWMITFADKYNIPLLGTLAAEKFEKSVAREWNKPGFKDTIREVYALNIKDIQLLRDSILRVLRVCGDNLFSGAEPQSFCAFVESIPKFAAESAARATSLLAARMKRETHFACERCPVELTIRKESEAKVNFCPSCGKRVRQG